MGEEQGIVLSLLLCKAMKEMSAFMMSLFSYNMDMSIYIILHI